jgi:hypothetical protein
MSLAALSGAGSRGLLARPAGGASDSCSMEIDIPELPVWLPEGDADGNELLPGNRLQGTCTWKGSGPPRRISIRVSPSTEPGQSTNIGDADYEDYAFEELYNTAVWKLGDPLAYPGTASLTMVTRQEIPAGQAVPFILSSYDWRGTCTVVAATLDDPACKNQKDVPQDSDKDRLPDPYEALSALWTAGRELKAYNPGAANSGGKGGKADAESDDDLDHRSPPMQEQFGDGLTAFEEYGAIRVNGKVKRTYDQDNDGPGGDAGGTHVKDAYLWDGGAAGGNPLFHGDNLYLDDFKLIWHLMAAADMPTPGIVNKNGNGSQRAVKLISADVKDPNTREPLLGLAGALKWNVNVHVRINTTYIRDLSRKLDLPLKELLDWTVAHEIGHRLGLEHNKGSRTLTAEAPAPLDLTRCWPGKADAETKRVFLAVPAYREDGGKAVPLETFERTEPELMLAGVGPPHARKGATVGVETPGDHPALILSFTFTTPPQEGFVVWLQAHRINLMDPVPDPKELQLRIKEQPLTDAQKVTPKLR